MKNLNSKKVLAVVILLLAVIIIAWLVLFRNKEEAVIIPTNSNPQSSAENSQEYTFASLIKTDSELNFNINKGDIFGGVFIFLRQFPEQKETRILEVKINKGEEILNLKDLCSELGVRIPNEISNKIVENYSLIGFFSQRENREWELKSLGLILKINPAESETVRESLEWWEGMMATDIYPLALIKRNKNLFFEEKEFQDGNYKGIEMRYSKSSFNTEGKALNYIFADDKIFIVTSRESVYAVIDSLG